MAEADDERGAVGSPELWEFLESVHPGEMRSGLVAAIERFGVFVALDDGPDHPIFPGAGFITIPELSWRRFDSASEIVEVGQRVTCEVLQIDTYHGEVRLSLRATQPDPFQEFARNHETGQVLQGAVTKLVPFGAFVRVRDGIEGLVHLSELSWTDIEAPEQAVRPGEQVTVVVTEIDLDRRRLALSRKRAPG
ncbi:S1 RNA-binding domain-containing protein [Actinomadura vinacea]|uniref:S1 RNA-binding domain-containing protein n=1 Tax=Actinomadura vinacea TaxID=115336 RepID=UPI0031DF5E37